MLLRNSIRSAKRKNHYAMVILFEFFSPKVITYIQEKSITPLMRGGHSRKQRSLMKEFYRIAFSLGRVFVLHPYVYSFCEKGFSQVEEKKYSKYFVKGPKEGSFRKFDVAFLDNTIIENSQYFAFSMIKPEIVPPDHGPHCHEFDEIMGFFSVDADDPDNLGAEFTLYVGEEMEPHTFSKPTLIYMPAGLPHGPIVHKSCDRPYLFLYTLPTPTLQETTRRDLMELVPEEDRKNVFFPYDEDKYPYRKKENEG